MLGTFLILKIINSRLHLSLGSDPPPEEEAGQEEAESVEELECDAEGEEASKKKGALSLSLLCLSE